jgi:hypothetical protein
MELVTFILTGGEAVMVTEPAAFEDSWVLLMRHAGCPQRALALKLLSRQYARSLTFTHDLLPERYGSFRYLATRALQLVLSQTAAQSASPSSNASGVSPPSYKILRSLSSSVGTPAVSRTAHVSNPGQLLRYFFGGEQSRAE